MNSVARPAPPLEPPALVGCRCVVTGASTGIGQVIATELVSAGATVCGVARRAGQLRVTSGLARGGLGRFDPHAADLCVDAEVRALAQDLARGAEGIDVLVHSAGVFARAPVRTAPIEDFDRQYAANVRGPYLLTQGLLPALRKARGNVIFINSSVVFGTARANLGQFSATQHALRSFADTLREEINQDGVRVVSIYLGRTATERQARIHRSEGRPYTPERLIQPSDVAEIVMKLVTVPWTAEITDVHVRPMLKS